jgi:hypothetical protein
MAKNITRMMKCQRFADQWIKVDQVLANGKLVMNRLMMLSAHFL